MYTGDEKSQNDAPVALQVDQTAKEPLIKHMRVDQLDFGNSTKIKVQAVSI